MTSVNMEVFSEVSAVMDSEFKTCHDNHICNILDSIEDTVPDVKIYYEDGTYEFKGTYDDITTVRESLETLKTKDAGVDRTKSWHHHVLILSDIWKNSESSICEQLSRLGLKFVKATTQSYTVVELERNEKYDKLVDDLQMCLSENHAYLCGSFEASSLFEDDALVQQRQRENKLSSSMSESKAFRKPGSHSLVAHRQDERDGYNSSSRAAPDGYTSDDEKSTADEDAYFKRDGTSGRTKDANHGNHVTHVDNGLTAAVGSGTPGSSHGLDGKLNLEAEMNSLADGLGSLNLVDGMQAGRDTSCDTDVGDGGIAFPDKDQSREDLVQQLDEASRESPSETEKPDSGSHQSPKAEESLGQESVGEASKVTSDMKSQQDTADSERQEFGREDRDRSQEGMADSLSKSDVTPSEDSTAEVKNVVYDQKDSKDSAADPDEL